MRDMPWHKHEEDAAKAKAFADQAYRDGNMVTYFFWQKIEEQKRVDARKACRQQMGKRS